MVDRLERREDADGCACLECRGVRTTATRRTTVDAIYWAGRFLRDRRSVLVLVLVLAGVQLGSSSGSLGVELASSGVAFLGGLFARNYVATLVAGAARDRRYSARTATRHALERFPAVFGTWAITFGGLVLLGGVSSVVVLGAASVWSPDALASSRVLPLGYAAMTVGSILLVAKFFLATEAAVVGGYGPIASLRVSWELVSFRRRSIVTLVGLITSVVALLVIQSGVFDALHGTGTASAAVAGVSTLATTSWYVISCVVFCQLYVTRVLE